jgi:hypothetical protein
VNIHNILQNNKINFYCFSLHYFWQKLIWLR